MPELIHPLPFASNRKSWSYLERDELGIHGASDLVYRVPAKPGEGPALPAHLGDALPLLLHELDESPAGRVLEKLSREQRDPYAPTGKTTLTRVLPRLLNYRFVESLKSFEFVFAGARPSSLHVLARVLGTDFKFRLEDLSHFATHGELLLKILHVCGLRSALDPEAILYCPAVDSPFPFKFMVVGEGGAKNRVTYVDLLAKLLRQTETDECFRDRHFKELARGFQKFGPAAATPQFQEVELRLWRVLGYAAARLRVKAGRLTSTDDPKQVRQFLGELRKVHAALDRLVHLPSRLAAYYRTHFQLEFGQLYEQALRELETIAEQVDCDMDSIDRSIEAIATTVSQFRSLGSASPLEGLEENDRDILIAYGEAPPPLDHGWVRTYTEAIFTGAERFDTRRFAPDSESGTIAEEDLSLDLDFGGGGPGGIFAEPAQADSDEGSLNGDEFSDLVDGSWGDEVSEESDEALDNSEASFENLWQEARDSLEDDEDD
jgi:hypothetical protein